MQTLLLSSTLHPTLDAGDDARTLRLMPKYERKNPHAQRRLAANKWLRLITVNGTESTLIDALVERTLASPFGLKVIVFVRNGRVAAKVASRIRVPLKKGKRDPNWVGLFGGPMRGAERDELTHDDLFSAFQSTNHQPIPVDERRILVCTSSLALGTVLNADHCVMDATNQRALPSEGQGATRPPGELVDLFPHLSGPN